jgi:glycosyltransferase involved in cell wall biosynthesis
MSVDVLRSFGWTSLRADAKIRAGGSFMNFDSARARSRVRSVGSCMLATSGGSSVMAAEIAWRMRHYGIEVSGCHCSSDVQAPEGVMALSKESSSHLQRIFDTDRCFFGGLDVCSQVLAWHRWAQFELLHVHALSVFGLPALHLKRLRGVPYVVTFHGSDLLNERFVEQHEDMIHEIVSEASAVTCVSEVLAKTLAERWPALQPAHVVHNFLRHEYEHAPRSAQDAGHRYLHVSSLRPVKRPELLAEAFRLVHAERPEASLTLVTTRPGMIRAQALVDQLGSGSSLVIVDGEGSVERVMEQYMGATALVLTSRFESFGLVMLEALACGVPVVAPAVPGIVDVLGEDWPLLVRDAAEPRAYAQAMLSASSLDVRGDVGERGPRILDRFDARVQIDSYLRIYENALRRSS